MLIRTIAMLTALALVGVGANAVACGGNKTDQTAKAGPAAKGGVMVTLAIEGMSCGACAAKITAALEKLDGVNAARVDLEHKQAKVRYIPKKVSVAQLVATIEALGFKVRKG